MQFSTDSLLTALFANATFSFVQDKHWYMRKSHFLNVKNTEVSLNKHRLPSLQRIRWFNKWKQRNCTKHGGAEREQNILM